MIKQKETCWKRISILEKAVVQGTVRDALTYIMNMIIDAYKVFQMPEAEGNRIFFHVKDVQNWDVYNYFMSTYSNMNRFKSFNLIKTGYSSNLLWSA